MLHRKDELKNLERLTHRGMWWVRLDRVEEILEEQNKELLDLIKYELVLLRKQDGERYAQDKNLVYSIGVGETLSKVSEFLESLNHHGIQ